MLPRHFLTACSLLLAFVAAAAAERPRILVFSKTSGYRHGSIPFGHAALDKLGAEQGFTADHTENSAAFTEANLARYRAVVFLNTTGNVLNPAQQNAFERYIQAGGGFVGIHAAADTEYAWPWYDQLMGAHFASHPNLPNVRSANVRITNIRAAATAGLPEVWARTDEWYNYRAFYPGLQVLAELDEESYEGGMNGASHPIMWQHEFDGGRAFYTGGGHTDGSFTEPLFVQHLWGGLQFAMGDGRPLDFARAHAQVVPEENRFEKTVLIDHLASPMELAVANDGRVFFTELAGKVFVYTPETNRTTQVLELPVSRAGGTGIIGITLDPDFDHNRHLYLYQSPPTEEAMITFHLARYTLGENGLIDPASEKILLRVPVSRKSGSHHGGSLAWDKEGHLYLSTGDSTAPHPAEGYAPLDERQDEEHRDQDSQRSAANSNDLRGKILRITPQPDGTYTIPAGNLFPPGMPLTRPEIYVIGARNPYRIAVNPKTSVVYWGEIGPDAGNDSPRGPRGYDEFNQAFKAGNFGWPYFVGNNYAYAKWDFVTRTPGSKQDPAAPRNDSPNNTGIHELPPAQPPFIWYPYAGSPEFPELGEGGRAAMVGDFYTYNAATAAPRAIPAYFDGGLFVFDWMRNWMRVIRVDGRDQYQRSEPFMSSNGDFRRPIDAAFSREGFLYVLEYGSVYGVDNDDARLVRIEYNAGNRPPVARAGICDAAADQVEEERSFLTSDRRRYHHELRKIAGPAPLEVAFVAKATDSDDDEQLRYEWVFDGKGVGARTAETKHTFTQPGVYSVLLRVTDKAGETGLDEVTVTVGNAPPTVAIETTANRSFFWEDRPLPYAVKVVDPDGTVDPQKVEVRFRYDAQPASGVLPLGATLMAASDCRACHTVEAKSVGPALVEIAQRYRDQAGAVPALAHKIIAGGGGNWSNQFVMAAHPQIPPEDAEEIVRYILTLGRDAGASQAEPLAGELKLDRHKEGEELGRYTLTASYTDAGKDDITGLTAKDEISLRSATVPAEYVDAYPGFNRWGPKVAFGRHQAHLYLRDIDLTAIAAFTFTYQAPQSGEIEIREYSANGPVIARVSFPAAKDDATVTAKLATPLAGRRDLYFIMRHPEKPNENVITVKTIRFERE